MGQSVRAPGSREAPGLRQRQELFLHMRRHRPSPGGLAEQRAGGLTVEPFELQLG